jgi:hypothetical protein
VPKCSIFLGFSYSPCCFASLLIVLEWANAGEEEEEEEEERLLDQVLTTLHLVKSH